MFFHALTARRQARSISSNAGGLQACRGDAGDGVARRGQGVEEADDRAHRRRCAAAAAAR